MKRTAAVFLTGNDGRFRYEDGQGPATLYKLKENYLLLSVQRMATE